MCGEREWIIHREVLFTKESKYKISGLDESNENKEKCFLVLSRGEIGELTIGNKERNFKNPAAHKSSKLNKFMSYLWKKESYLDACIYTLTLNSKVELVNYA